MAAPVLSRWANSGWLTAGATQWRLHRYYHTSKPLLSSGGNQPQNGDPTTRRPFNWNSESKDKAPKKKKQFKHWDRRDKVTTTVYKPWRERKAAMTERKREAELAEMKAEEGDPFVHWQPSDVPPNQLEEVEEDGTTKEKLKILFMGRDEFSCLVFQQLYAAKDVWDELVVATSQDQRTGRRGSELSISPLKSAVQGLNDDKLRLEYIPDTKPQFRTWQLPAPFQRPLPIPESLTLSPPPEPIPPLPNHILITASFGRILTRTHLSHFQPTRRLNVHPSLLPQYRGPAPIQHSILNNDTETGVCVIQMLEAARKKKVEEQGAEEKPKSKIDAGGIWASKTVPQQEDADFTGMRDVLAVEGGQLLVNVLRKMRDGIEGEPRPQLSPAEEGVDLRPAPMITPEDALVDPMTMTAEEIYVRFRAIGHQRPITTYRLTPTSPPTPIQLHSLELTQAHKDLTSLPSEPGSAILHTGQGRAKRMYLRCAGETCLTVGKVKVAGKPLLSAAEFWNGLKLGPGKEGEKDYAWLAAHKDNLSGKRRGMFGQGTVVLGVLPSSPSVEKGKEGE